jgi:hypothetical protein
MDELFKVTPQIPEEPVGWLNANLSKSVMSRLWGYIETAKKNPINYNDKLVGNICWVILGNIVISWIKKQRDKCYFFLQN